jgi:hypothetical protein
MTEFLTEMLILWLFILIGGMMLLSSYLLIKLVRDEFCGVKHDRH